MINNPLIGGGADEKVTIHRRADCLCPEAGRAGKKELTLARLREWVRDLQVRYGAGERQVCFALRVSRSSFRYRSVATDDSALRLRIREITETRVYYGYRRVHVMLRR